MKFVQKCETHAQNSYICRENAKTTKKKYREKEAKQMVYITKIQPERYTKFVTPRHDLKHSKMLKIYVVEELRTDIALYNVHNWLSMSTLLQGGASPNVICTLCFCCSSFSLRLPIYDLVSCSIWIHTHTRADVYIIYKYMYCD